MLGVKRTAWLGVLIFPWMAACNGTGDAGPEVASRVDAGAPRHRATEQTCGVNSPPGAKACAQDIDCGASLRCHEGVCAYDACWTSADCDAGTVCTCSPDESDFGANECSPAHCRLDSDCGDGFFCSPSGGEVPCTGLTWYCHGPNDTCRDDSDCPGEICLYSVSSGAWSCAAAPLCG